MIINGKYIGNVNLPVEKQKTVKSSEQTNNTDFKNLLDSKLKTNGDIKISKHAEIRMSERNINLTAQLKEKINQAVDRASEKGVKDSLVIVDDVAFIVNVKNRVVVTAVNNEELKKSVFTNIDGAVIG